MLGNLGWNSKAVTVEVANPPLSYLKVVVFDVEHNRSVATLSIPGNIIIATYHSSKSMIAKLMSS